MTRDELKHQVAAVVETLLQKEETRIATMTKQQKVEQMRKYFETAGIVDFINPGMIAEKAVLTPDSPDEAWDAALLHCAALTGGLFGRGPMEAGEAEPLLQEYRARITAAQAGALTRSFLKKPPQND